MQPAAESTPAEPSLGELIKDRFHPHLALVLGLVGAYFVGSLGLGIFGLVIILWISYVVLASL
jgi:hypothetical protein